MADAPITTDSYPEEYSREPVYGRPPNASMVKQCERVFKNGMTTAEAIRESPQ